MKRSKELTANIKSFSRTLLLLCLILPFEAPAVMFLSKDDPTHNTTPPSDPAAARDWRLQGIWRTCQGTPVAPSWFLSAKHIGGAIGDSLTVEGKTHHAIARILDPESDLVLWGVMETFQEHAKLYTGGDESGKRMLVFGRGAVRGKPVMLESNGNLELKGWERGKGKAVMRWGENIVTHIADDPVLIKKGLGQLIGAEFNRNGLPDEAGISPCDSGGGMFLLQDEEWRLAAMSYAAGGQYNTSQEGDGFPAMLFDEGGYFRYTELFDENVFVWELIDNDDADLPSSIWGTRIQYRMSWIEQSIAAMPEPKTSIVLESAPTLTGPFEKESDWTLIQEPLALRIPAPEDSRYYRIQATDTVNMRTPIISDTHLLLPFSGR